MNNYAYLGIVDAGEVSLLAAEDRGAGRFRLTTAATGEPSPAESEISLAAYEGRAIMVRGIAKGSWIHGASVIDEAGPMLTLVVLAAFESRADTSLPDLPA